MKGIIKGALSYVEGFQIISKYNLWLYFWAPAGVSLVLGFIIFGSAYGLSDNIGDLLISLYPFEWGKAALETALSVFGGLLIAVIGLIIFKQLVIALSSPFMSPMSETIEKRLMGIDKQIPFKMSKFVRDLVRGLTIALRNIIRELFFTLLLFVLGAVIPILSPFTTVLIFLIQSYYAGFGNMDFTLERYFGVRDSVKFVRKNWTLALGNGMVFIGALFTCIGFLFVVPLGAAAATSETLKRLS